MRGGGGRGGGRSGGVEEGVGGERSAKKGEPGVGMRDDDDESTFSPLLVSPPLRRTFASPAFPLRPKPPASGSRTSEHHRQEL